MSKPFNNSPLSQSVLVRTKFNAPSLRPGTVVRQRLFAQLGLPQPAQLTLVQATAGSGKTTVVLQWLAQIQLDYVWFNIEEGDDHPLRFWRYLIGALQTFESDLGVSALDYLSQTNPGAVETAVSLIINDLTQLDASRTSKREDRDDSQQPSLLIVLDDFHNLNDKTVLDSFSRFLDYLPTSVHVVITSRSSPALSLGKRRVRNAITEITNDMLCFDNEEAQAFFQQTMTLDFDQEQVEQLCSQTAGWVAGLQLAGLSLRALPKIDGAKGSQRNACLLFSGDHQTVVEYIEEEIVSRLPQQEKEFLIQASVLSTLSPSLCDAVIELSDPACSEELIYRLENSHLFVSRVDAEGQWFQLHGLFKTALEAIARRHYAAMVNAVHQRAAAWFIASREEEEALFHLIALKQWQQAVDIIESTGLRQALGAFNERVEWWLAQLPEHWLAERPKLALIKAWGLFGTTELMEGERYLHLAEQKRQQLNEMQEISPEDNEFLRSNITVLGLLIARVKGDWIEVGNYTREASALSLQQQSILPSSVQLGMGLELFQSGDLTEAKAMLIRADRIAREEENLFCVLATSLVLGMVLYHLGFTQDAIDHCDEVEQWLLSKNQNSDFVRSWQCLVMIDFYRELNHLDVAGEMVTFMSNLLSAQPQATHIASFGIMHAAYLMSSGQYDCIERILDETYKILSMNTSQWSMSSPDKGALKAKYGMMAGQFQLAFDWAEHYQKGDQQKNPIIAEEVVETSADNVVAMPLYNMIDEAILLARVFGYQNRYEASIALLQRARARAANSNRVMHVVKTYVVEALVNDRHYRNKAALSALQMALKLAGDSYRRLFLDEGASMLGLLRALHQQGLTGWWSSLFESNGDSGVVSFSANNTASPERNSGFNGLLDNLTMREREVLQEINSGASNQQISDKLKIAVTTTKAHIRNIYEKMGVNSRTQAILKARDAGLLQ